MNEGLANAASLPDGFLVISGEVQPGDLDRIRLQWPQIERSDEPHTLHVRPGLTVHYAPVHKNQAPSASVPEGILVIRGERTLTDEQIAALRADWDRLAALPPGTGEPIAPGLTVEYRPAAPVLSRPVDRTTVIVYYDRVVKLVGSRHVHLEFDCPDDVAHSPEGVVLRRARAERLTAALEELAELLGEDAVWGPRDSA